jgi:hypothetical protein
MPTERYHFCAAVVGGKICVAGGCSNAASNTTALRYDPVADSWSEIPAPAVALDGLMLIIGGYASGTHGFVQACKPGFAWKPRVNLPTGRACSAAVDFVDLATVEEYFP